MRAVFLAAVVASFALLGAAAEAEYVSDIPSSTQKDKVFNITCRGTFTTYMEKVVSSEVIAVELCYRNVRLALVDGYGELNESVERQARSYLRGVCTPGMNITVDQDLRNRFDADGNIVGIVYCNTSNVNLNLVERGLARVHNESCKSSEFIGAYWARATCFEILNATGGAETVVNATPDAVNASGDAAEEPEACGGCELGSTCLNRGDRISNLYCPGSGDLVRQRGYGQECEEGFQCADNVCTAGQCRGLNMFESITAWFRDTLGIESIVANISSSAAGASVNESWFGESPASSFVSAPSGSEPTKNNAYYVLGNAGI